MPATERNSVILSEVLKQYVFMIIYLKEHYKIFFFFLNMLVKIVKNSLHDISLISFVPRDLK